MKYIFQDWNANRANIKARLVLVLFRLCHLATYNRGVFILLIPVLLFYRIVVEWFLGIELPYKTRIGKGLKLYHGQALVINDGCVLGNNCEVRNSTTIGNKQLADGSYSKSPIIGNDVQIGVNVCIIGPIVIGDNVKIGAGSVVVKNVPSNCVVAGNPAQIIKLFI